MTIQIDAPELEAQEGEELHKMASGLHSKIAGRLFRYIGNYVDDNQLGHTLESSATYNFQDNQPKRQPDASFVSFASLTEIPDEELVVAPELAVEVVSKNDTVYEIENKVRQYQAAGVRLVWVIRPFSRSIEIYRLKTGLIHEVVGPDEELDGEDVIQGFKLSVNKLFK